MRFGQDRASGLEGKYLFFRFGLHLPKHYINTVAIEESIARPIPEIFSAQIEKGGGSLFVPVLPVIVDVPARFCIARGKCYGVPHHFRTRPVGLIGASHKRISKQPQASPVGKENRERRITTQPAFFVWKNWVTRGRLRFIRCGRRSVRERSAGDNRHERQTPENDRPICRNDDLHARLSYAELAKFYIMLERTDSETIHLPGERRSRLSRAVLFVCVEDVGRGFPSPAVLLLSNDVFAEHRHGITLSVVQFSSKVPTSQAMSPDPATTIFAETKVSWKPGWDISEDHTWRIAIVPVAWESADADDCRGLTDVCCSHQPRYWRQRRDAGLARLRR